MLLGLGNFSWIQFRAEMLCSVLKVVSSEIIQFCSILWSLRKAWEIFVGSNSGLKSCVQYCKLSAQKSFNFVLHCEICEFFSDKILIELSLPGGCPSFSLGGSQALDLWLSDMRYIVLNLNEKYWTWNRLCYEMAEVLAMKVVALVEAQVLVAVWVQALALMEV